MNTVTLLVGVILYGSTPGATTMSSKTSAYPDIKSCAAAPQQELEANNKPGVYSVSGTCTLLRPKLIGGET
jgi:hypothetical protein